MQHCAAITVFFFLAGLLEEMFLRKLTGMHRTGIPALLAAGTAALYLGIHGYGTEEFVNVLFLEILLYAAVYDFVTHTVPDYAPVMILMTGLFHVRWLPAMLGFLLVPLPFLAAALLKEGSVGGGDIKLMAACGFVLGVSKGYTAMVAGLCLAVVSHYADSRKKEEAFPMVPYLAAGCLLAALQK